MRLAMAEKVHEDLPACPKYPTGSVLSLLFHHLTGTFPYSGEKNALGNEENAKEISNRSRRRLQAHVNFQYFCDRLQYENQ